ncbi:uncharacterized protein LOC143464846 [Clavelina lepadiformis]|uniref:uncharacterized protein LOC143464846 n=1 Tax=Clavelina lepadiformis TaxID=159417 RepID=UPI0040426EB3
MKDLITDDDDLKETSGDVTELADGMRNMSQTTAFEVNTAANREGSADFQDPTGIDDYDVTTAATTHNTSVVILITVSIIALLTIFMFIVVTFRYRFAHKGTYTLREFPLNEKGKEDINLENIESVCKETPTREWLL